MNGRWVEPDVRDQAVDFVNKWSKKTPASAASMLRTLGLRRNKFSEWKRRYGQPNEHNGKVCRDFWLLDEEKRAIIAYAAARPGEGYRRLAYMMMDAQVCAASPASVYRVLKSAGMLGRWTPRSRAKGKGFHQPLKAHEHWHVDISYINVSGTFYYLCSVLDGYSRAIVHWSLLESMKERDVEMVIQKAHETCGQPKARVISDNGPQFIARDFKEFIRALEMTHVRTRPYYPQSNGKIERMHKSLKDEAIRRNIPVSLDDARRIVGDWIVHYNNHRLHSAVGYVTPRDMLDGKRDAIHKTRDARLEAARKNRQERRRQSDLTPAGQRRTAINQPEKRKRALEESNPPGISGRDEQPRQSAQAADCHFNKQRLVSSNA